MTIFSSAVVRRLLLVSGALAVGWLAIVAHHRLLAAGVLLRFEHAREPAWVVHYRERTVDVGELSFATGSGRIYVPRAELSPRGIVLVHGMHEAGVDEPRLVSFARALAGAGFRVFTPRMDGLAHYRLSAEDVARVAAAARALGAETHEPKVIVFGISFGGGMAIRAACEPRLGAPIARVIALGAHHDAERVSRFYLGAPARDPAGHRARVEPHPFGRLALWMSLFGQPHTGAFSAEERVRAEAALEMRRDALAAVSPSHCSAPLTAPLYLAHGSADRVVPYTETLWNERAFMPARSLISPAIAHAEYDPPGFLERLELVAFLAAALW